MGRRRRGPSAGPDGAPPPRFNPQAFAKVARLEREYDVQRDRVVNIQNQLSACVDNPQRHQYLEAQLANAQAELAKVQRNWLAKKVRQQQYEESFPIQSMIAEQRYQLQAPGSSHAPHHLLQPQPTPFPTTAGPLGHGQPHSCDGHGHNHGPPAGNEKDFVGASVPSALPGEEATAGCIPPQGHATLAEPLPPPTFPPPTFPPPTFPPPTFPPPTYQGHHQDGPLNLAQRLPQTQTPQQSQRHLQLETPPEARELLDRLATAHLPKHLQAPQQSQQSQHQHQLLQALRTTIGHSHRQLQYHHNPQLLAYQGHHQGVLMQTPHQSPPLMAHQSHQSHQSHQQQQVPRQQVPQQSSALLPHQSDYEDMPRRPPPRPSAPWPPGTKPVPQQSAITFDPRITRISFNQDSPPSNRAGPAWSTPTRLRSLSDRDTSAASRSAASSNRGYGPAYFAVDETDDAGNEKVVGRERRKTEREVPDTDESSSEQSQVERRTRRRPQRGTIAAAIEAKMAELAELQKRQAEKEQEANKRSHRETASDESSSDQPPVKRRTRKRPQRGRRRVTDTDDDESGLDELGDYL